MTQDNGIAKTIKIMALHILPFFALFLFAFLSLISGKSSIACEGIAVDQNNNLYIGRGDKLIV
ncbi:MAG: hypothetical protein IIY16_00445, partial [Oscillospiraceae bacterium]|nr:hypothetical protein [Oscillospiraceae bacterium]